MGDRTPDRVIIGEPRAVLIRPVVRRTSGNCEIVAYEAWLSLSSEVGSPTGRWVPLVELLAGAVRSLRLQLSAPVTYASGAGEKPPTGQLTRKDGTT